MSKKAVLALEDGRVFYGNSFGAEGERTGEVVFNTSMTGYQEILTDPSYRGQIVVMTYPHIGNYGVNSEDRESAGPWVEGFVVREYSKFYSNWRAQKSLSEFLKEHKVIALEGIDTRALVKHIREKGAMKGIISTETFSEKVLVEKARSAPGLVGRDLVKEVTTKTVVEFDSDKFAKRVVVIDCGVKRNILRILKSFNCKLILVPASSHFQEILALKPDGVLISNGPGDPEGVPYLVNTIRCLIKEKPNLVIFGICFGHQILGLAFGAKTYKLKFGHRGANQPIKNLLNGRVEITVENHGFAVAKETLKDFTITHINLNDGTLEGMKHNSLPVFSVQFHPEASPGPHDSRYLFEEFIGLIENAKKN